MYSRRSNILDFDEARDDGLDWVVVASAGPYADCLYFTPAPHH